MIKNTVIRMPESVLSLRLFGSFARAENDALSDLDILAVVDTDFTKENAFAVVRDLESLFNRKISVSWYGKSRMAEFFEIGHLFAWHIFRESFSLLIPSSNDVVKGFGSPSKYRGAEEDIISLIEILDSTPGSLERCAQNASYEGGLIFVCLRNIALSASWYASTGLCFSRMSPYVLERFLGIKFPMAISEYEALMKARLCGQRGIPFRILEKSEVLLLWGRGSEWAREILSFVREVKYEHEFQQTSIPSENRVRA